MTFCWQLTLAGSTSLSKLLGQVYTQTAAGDDDGPDRMSIAVGSQHGWLPDQPQWQAVSGESDRKKAQIRSSLQVYPPWKTLFPRRGLTSLRRVEGAPHFEAIRNDIVHPGFAIEPYECSADYSHRRFLVKS
jgi:hypothetical protein